MISHSREMQSQKIEMNQAIRFKMNQLLDIAQTAANCEIALSVKTTRTEVELCTSSRADVVVWAMGE